MKSGDVTHIDKLLLKKEVINKIIENQVRKDKDIIYGSKSMNIQTNPTVRREAGDYDIFSKKPQKHIYRLDKKLDKFIGGNEFYVVPALHKGTWKLKHIGVLQSNSRDDISIADYSKGHVPYVVIGGIKYEKLSNIIKGKKKILKDKESKYRHFKDDTDLRMIKIGKEINSLGGGKW
jgi:hypothetical protein